MKKQIENELGGFSREMLTIKLICKLSSSNMKSGGVCIDVLGLCIKLDDFFVFLQNNKT